MSDNHNGRVKTERYGGTLLVYVPQVKWYQLSLPYTSELERTLRPAIDEEERAILVAPDKQTQFFLKLERFPKHIPVMVGEKEAKSAVDIGQWPE